MPLPQRRRRRKPSPDKEIEAILVLKDSLEDQVFAFNADIGILRREMGALRRGLAGLGDRRLNLPPGKITQPFHPKISTFLSQVTNRYKGLAARYTGIQELAQEIIQKQDELARSKTQHSKLPASPDAQLTQTTPQQPAENKDPVAKIFSAEEQAELVSLATNPFSRALYYMKTPFSGDPHRAMKRDLLKLAVIARKETKVLQKAALTSGAESISIINKSFQELEERLESLPKLLGNISSRFENSQLDVETVSTLIGNDPVTSKMKTYEMEFNIIGQMGFVSNHSQFSKLHIQFKRAQDGLEKKRILDEVQLHYEKTLKALHERYPHLKFTSVSDLYPQVNIQLLRSREVMPYMSDDVAAERMKFLEAESSFASILGFSRFTSEFNKILHVFRKAQTDQHRGDLTDRANNMYRLLMREVSKKYPIAFESIQELVTKINSSGTALTPANDIQGEVPEEMQKAALLPLSIKKLRYKMPFADETASLRLAIYTGCKKIKKQLEKFMDVITSNGSLTALVKSVNDIRTSLEVLRRDKMTLVGILKKKHGEPSPLPKAEK